MALYKIKSDELQEVAATKFPKEDIKERYLQKLLKEKIEVIAPDTLVIAEEYGNFEGSKRRIDLLGIDKDANLVVIELKRTEGGGHMELQAIRYSAMVSNMTFEQAVSVYNDYMDGKSIEADAEEELLDFLGWSEPNDDEFCQDVKIVLASEDFSKELTAAILWLNERDLDITCFRMKPYKLDQDTLLDVQRIIPLPETTDYQIQIREKRQKEKQARGSNRDLTKYDLKVGNEVYEELAKRRLAYHVVVSIIKAGNSPEDIIKMPEIRRSHFAIVEGELSADEMRDVMTEKRERRERSPKPSRYFIGEGDEVFHADGKTYAVTKQWGARTIPFVVRAIESFPELNIKYKPCS